jgi:hypothetical protein
MEMMIVAAGGIGERLQTSLIWRRKGKNGQSYHREAQLTPPQLEPPRRRSSQTSPPSSTPVPPFSDPRRLRLDPLLSSSLIVNPASTDVVPHHLPCLSAPIGVFGAETSRREENDGVDCNFGKSVRIETGIMKISFIYSTTRYS